VSARGLREAGATSEVTDRREPENWISLFVSQNFAAVLCCTELKERSPSAHARGERKREQKRRQTGDRQTDLNQGFENHLADVGVFLSLLFRRQELQIIWHPRTSATERQEAHKRTQHRPQTWCELNWQRLTHEHHKKRTVHVLFGELLRASQRHQQVRQQIHFFTQQPLVVLPEKNSVSISEKHESKRAREQESKTEAEAVNLSIEAAVAKSANNTAATDGAVLKTDE
jgi:hypothetical protein